jgi:AraC-like DNA-binding protein/quercetin dioxygenase-like cupin family protein
VVNKQLPVYDIEKFRYLGEENNFYANTFKAHLKQHQHIILAPHRHDFYVGMIFLKGSGTHQVEFNNYEIKPGHVFMIAPGEVHDWKLSKNIDGYIFFHTKEFFDLNFTYEKADNYPFYCCLRNNPLIPLKNKSRRKINEIFSEIVDEYKRNELLKFQKISSLLNVLYIALSRIYLPDKFLQSKNLNYLSRLKQLDQLIEKHFIEYKYPKDFALLMHMSEKHLNRICKTCLNKTTSQLIVERVLLEAKRRLAFAKSSISQIAEELGYTNTSYFIQLFKKKTGQTPAEFMQTFRETASS